MKINRRSFLQSTAAAAAVGTFGPNAWAEDPITFMISPAAWTSTENQWSMR
jgi:hypothetical protein